MKKSITQMALLALTIMSFGLNAQTSPVPNAPGQMVDVGGHKLHFYVRGDGPETIVIEAGSAAWSVQWLDLQEALAKQFRVVTYDRAGYGWSEASPYSRTANQIVEELHTGLEKLGISTPVVLLGHSYGGLIIKAYAKKYPEQIRGLIFADAATEFQFEKLPQMVSIVLESGKQRFKQLGPMARSGMLTAEQIPIDSALNQNFWKAYQASMARGSAYDAMYNELDLLHTSYIHAQMSEPIDKPVLVISAGNSFGAFQEIPNMPVEESNKVWAGLQKNLLSVSTKSQQSIIKGATHDLLLSVPEDLRKVVVRFVKGL